MKFFILVVVSKVCPMLESEIEASKHVVIRSFFIEVVWSNVTHNEKVLPIVGKLKNLQPGRPKPN